MKIVLTASSFPKYDIINLIRESSDDTKFIFKIKKTGEWKSYDFSEFGDRVFTFSEINEVINYNDFESTGLIVLIHKVLDDHQTMLFSDRESILRKYGLGIGNFSRYVAKLVANYYHFYLQHTPDILYFESTPHHIESWVSAVVAEELGITILVSTSTELPWRRYLVKGIRKERKICKINPKSNQINNITKEKKLIENFINLNQGDYNEAMPEYERKKMIKNKGKYFNLYRELINWYDRPDLIMNKYFCYKKYLKLSSNIDSKEKYIVLFLHYQPERTSLPEGYGFAQQIIAILALRIATPKEVTIFVKEHPSMFTHKCDIFQRHPSFYEQINSINGVKLLDINSDTFKVIDNAIAVATITGTVGIQSLIRGKPVIFFGKSMISNKMGVEHYQDENKLRSFIQGCIAGIDPDLIKNEFHKRSIENIEFSISGCLDYEAEKFNFITLNKILNLKSLNMLLNGDIIIT